MRRRVFAMNGLGPALLGSACVITTLATPAHAQQAPAATPPLEEVVVTGIRRSLQDATDAKKEATGFTDSIFAEDIGKFPDTNIAESFNRVPGITIQREISGEGLQIAIRGLGQNFTRVLLNGAPVAVASTGRTDAQSANREVDLDLFPTELFTQLTVRKSASASMLEGGAAGTVDMRSARPFDREGQRLTYALQGTKNSNADSWGDRGSLLASKTWEKFGILIGAAGVRNESRVVGFEANEYTNTNVTLAQCVPNPAGTATNPCNANGGNQINIPATVPTNVAAATGLPAGATIDRAFLLAQNPGLSIEQIDNALVPRLGRPSDEFGTRNRYNGIVSLEFRATDNLHFYLDSLYGKKENDLARIDMNLVGRSSALIPLNMKVDRSDCSRNCVVTSATFANAQFFLEYRPFIEDTEFWGANPGFDWQLTDALKLDVQVNKTHSNFHRESPTALVITPTNANGSTTMVDYVNDGSVPRITSNVDLNNPANFGWVGGRVNMQDEKRTTDTKGGRFNLSWNAFDAATVRFGGAYDDVSRRIQAFDNTQPWSNAVCGGNPNVFIDPPNTQPPCQGLAAGDPALAGYPTYPGIGTGFSAGKSGPVVYQGSLIPQSALSSYLYPGPDGFITLDWDRFKADSQYDRFHDATPLTGTSNTQAATGLVNEKITGAYVEVSGDTMIGDNRLRYTAGLRRVRTEQTIEGRTTRTDPRTILPNGSQIADGSRFPVIVDFPAARTTYFNTLPAFEVAYNLTEQTVVRGAVSKTMTRPDPSQMLPGLNFSSTTGDAASLGNSALEPFESENIDVGFEHYTGQEGYFGVAAFRKRVTGFTVNQVTTVPFTSLAQYGVTFDTITPQQQAAINLRGGPNAAVVALQQQVNASGALTVNGLEFNLVQPLDRFIGRWGLDGFGIAANLTLINQSGQGAAPAVAINVAPHTYNLTAYYEKHGVSVRLSETFTAGSQNTTNNRQTVRDAAIFGDDYEQWDFSAGLDLSELFGWENNFELTFDGINIFNRKQRAYLQFPNAAQTVYEPGRQYMIGLRGRF